MTESRPLILLTNDDGIHAAGLEYLKSAAERVGDVRIVAPQEEQSAVGHAITLYGAIRVREVHRNGVFYGFGARGTPADSVKLALHTLLPRHPDLVISGINDGANLGINVLYSGTVSAATEAAILGVPGIAVSLAQKIDPPFEYALPHVERVARWVLEHGLPPGVALNVNIPALPPDRIKGYRLTSQGLRKMTETFEKREDSKGNTYYWLSGEATARETRDGIDITAVNDGYVSVTPLFYDLTAHSRSREISRSWETL